MYNPSWDRELERAIKTEGEGGRAIKQEERERIFNPDTIH